MAGYFGFGSSADITITLNDSETLPYVEQKDGQGGTERLFLFSGRETVAGTVAIALTKGKKIEHQGIKVELVGQIELVYERSNPYDFTSLQQVLEEPGELLTDKTYNFEFVNCEKRHETYTGENVRLRYFLRVKISRAYNSNISKTLDFAVQNIRKSQPKPNTPIKMEVGIEDCLHIEFEYTQSWYHMREVLIGKIYFLLVRIKIKRMEIVIRRRESTGSGSNSYASLKDLHKFELMDGAPAAGESIPIRLYLGGGPYSLTPTFKNVHDRFSVKYFVNLILVDEEDRRYFKQQEIYLWRKELEPANQTRAVPTSAPPRPITAGDDGKVHPKQKQVKEKSKKHLAKQAPSAPVEKESTPAPSPQPVEEEEEVIADVEPTLEDSQRTKDLKASSVAPGEGEDNL